MNWWFIFLILVYLLNISTALENHGKVRESKYNFYSALLGSLMLVFVTYMAIKTGF